MRTLALAVSVLGIALPSFAQETAAPIAPPVEPAPAPSDSAPKLSETEIRANEELVATIAVTRGQDPFGQIVIRLHHKYAPAHVKNFVKLAESGFYEGTTFHRVSPESFIQGGDPNSRDADPKNDGTGGPGYDLSPQPNDKQNVRGAVTAAKPGARDSGCQFFVNLKEHPEWDQTYTVFGSVISGIEVADKIGAAKRRDERPVDDFKMSVKVEKRARQLKLY